MTPNPLQKPQKPTTKIIPNPPQHNNNSGGNNNRGNNNNNNSGGNNNNREPSPWLDENNPPSPHQNASFVEYLRWMRSPDHPQKDGTKTQILTLATQQKNHSDRLEILNQRLALMAGKENTFQVKSSWRIRVGGHRGPENILLPAFDALGMPFIPSSTLRGVARTYAIREIMTEEKIEWKDAEKLIAKYFGLLDVEKENQAGKVIFFDAYPLPNQVGLKMDMANNIWQWKNNQVEYAPNPNPFLTLKEPTFLIGLKLASGVEDQNILTKVKHWLIKGLESGVGSQINTGYGQLIKAGVGQPTTEFYRVEFALEGQLIHGYQKFSGWERNINTNNWQPQRTNAESEVRPTAFKSMLRYWFRTFALGVLSPDKVKTIEGELFGAIDPQKWGYLQVNILEGKVTRKAPEARRDKVGEEEGILTLSLSINVPKDKQETVKKLTKNLTLLLFNLGGIGQGARRPCYDRTNRPHAPWYRGSTFYIEGEENPELNLPKTPKECAEKMRSHLTEFYQLLAELTGEKINYQQLKEVKKVTEDQWPEAIDKNAQIVICKGQGNNDKPFALSILHDQKFKIRGDYDGNLCGRVRGNVKPSPVWIADLGDYQIVTIFGANMNPRKEYLKVLKDQSETYIKVFPLQ